MIRTRDLVLFAVVIVFLVMAIGTTLWTEVKNDAVKEEMTFMPGEASKTAAGVDSEEIDRLAIAERLKQAILKGDSAVDPVPSVTTEADTHNETVAQTMDIQRCLNTDDVLPKIGKWPLKGTKIEVREGARVFVTEEMVAQVTADSASTTTRVEKVWLTLPLLTAATGEYCVPSEVVGVTPRGVLIFNHDVADYKNTSPNELIGYARDGHPIYGAYTGETDSCGGYSHPAGYRYVIKPEQNFIIGCFTAPPQAFNL